MRKLSPEFIHDLSQDNGLLNQLLKRVKNDNTLLLSIRDEYINIYYRGGNLLRVKRQAKGAHTFHFDYNYNESGLALPELPSTITRPEQVRQWIEAFPLLRGSMDDYFARHNKPEREFQQLIARENNFSSISNQTEYFITDIEFSDPGISARFDMLAIKWPAADRKDGKRCRVAMIEMKYGDNALGGEAGIIKHLEDFDTFIADAGRYNALLETMTSQFNQLDQLGLLQFRHAARSTEVKLDVRNKPEVVFVFANHNPRSTKLLSILDDPKVSEYTGAANFDLKFFVSSFVGYAFHANCMYNPADFRQLLKKQTESK